MSATVPAIFHPSLTESAPASLGPTGHATNPTTEGRPMQSSAHARSPAWIALDVVGTAGTQTDALTPQQVDAGAVKGYALFNILDRSLLCLQAALAARMVRRRWRYDTRGASCSAPAASRTSR
jgi:hypothetical protein